MGKELRKYILVQATASLIINGLLNGLIIFFLAWGKTAYAIGRDSILITLAIDNIITCPLLALFAADGAVKNLMKEKMLFSLPPFAGLAWLSTGMKRPKRCGLLIGSAAIIIVFGLSASGVYLLGVETLTKWGYIIYKALYTGVLGAGFSALFLSAALRRPEGVAGAGG